MEGKEVWTNVQFRPHWPGANCMSNLRLRLYLTPDRLFRRGCRLRQRLHYISDFCDLPTSIAKEGSRLVVVDECQLIFGSTDNKPKVTLDWLKWFSQSRKYGCDILLVAQDHQLIARPIRLLAEQLETCYNLSRLSIPVLFERIPIGAWITRFIGPVFLRRMSMVGMKGLLLGKSLTTVPWDVARLYDTTQIVVRTSIHETTDQADNFRGYSTSHRYRDPVLPDGSVIPRLATPDGQPAWWPRRVTYSWEPLPEERPWVGRYVRTVNAETSWPVTARLDACGEVQVVEMPSMALLSPPSHATEGMEVAA